MYPTSGYTYPEPKVCIRCGGPNDCALYSLCQICRDGDALAAFFLDEEEDRRASKDLADTISYCREGW
jgi:hypothetical protein